MNDTVKKTPKPALAQRLRTWIRPAITVLAVALAGWAAWLLWDHYERAPWTRDGRVRANVIQLAPDVSGLVSALHVQDNQSVHAGDVLFEVDRARFQLAQRQAQAALQAQRTVLAQAEREWARNKALSDLVAHEQQEQTRARVLQAQAQVAESEVALESARLNLQRALVQAPSDGVVTNLELRQGAYATAGKPVLALVDQASLYVEGYFEETKLARIHIGDRVRVTPMGSANSLQGRVQSVAVAIADHDRSTSANLLPSVNPTFNWVRLAQRIPVRVQLDAHQDMALVAGQTVTVQVLETTAPDPEGETR